MDVETLQNELRFLFPIVAMPSENELILDDVDDEEAQMLQVELQDFRGKELNGDDIRKLNLEMYYLSSAAWRWILPYFLRYCLSPEGQYTKGELAGLIFKLNPKAGWKENFLERISFLNLKQIEFLQKYLTWLLTQDYWDESYVEEINGAVNFLNDLKISKS